MAHVLRLKVKLLIIMVLVVVNTILLAIVKPKQAPYDLTSFIKASIFWPSSYSTEAHDEDWDKVIVTPARDVDDISWIAQDLPGWQHAIYYVDHPSSVARKGHLRTPINKGNEAMAYLTYIVDHYHKQIPSIVAFLHSHHDGFWKAWHVDDPLHDNANALQHLQLDYVKQQGYVNLRCNWAPGCTKLSIPNPHISNETWHEIFANTSTPYFDSDPFGPAASSKIPGEQHHDEVSSSRIWTSCCAQFAVSREQIHRRPVQDYVNIRQWLLNTELDDASSGRTLEYLWHVIFGKEAIQ
ncbi:hypothetical protein LTR47_010899 [Exophiala xenobiotica]|nr:hypothetical protein LTR92_005458 [Exophiala xenobiotica]KAK5207719.1 hypothetical protein LTR41_006763 [Exophiala xenobiotica]KAK5221513.1 hypothetical protein LTR47_010899 [Exophiala xenobiotica]KAK5246043.1 hypothetical protein LTS06_008603 [Exophiala xenobiotica]KAK5280688.1 hypothetical protein LTR40_005975 [Exophiala xenobiotica]